MSRKINGLIDRRTFLKAAGAGYLMSLAPQGAVALDRTDAVYATAFQRRTGEYCVGILTESGTLVSGTTLPGRGHDVAHHCLSNRSVVFARQPGTFAMAFDRTGRSPPMTIASVEGRHYFGHGEFSPDGRLLYVTENDFDNAAGMIGVYDVADGYRRIGEFPTHGVGPHELLLMPYGKTLAIANGGIETHPDFGRAKLNLSTMQPSLAFVDCETGELLERHVLPPELHQLSIRHMDLDARGRVWFGCQYEGAATDTPPLCGVAEIGADPRLIDMPETARASFRNYIGSVAANRECGLVAFSSPEGNVVTTLDTVTGRVVASRTMREVCGLAAEDSGFVATTGEGMVAGPDGAVIRHDAIVWDNHMLKIG